MIVFLLNQLFRNDRLIAGRYLRRMRSISAVGVVGCRESWIFCVSSCFQSDATISK